MKVRMFISLLMVSAILSLAALAETRTDLEAVRQMCTAPDNQDFSVFDQRTLPAILIDIILNDPSSALYHERVVASALKELGRLNVPEGLPVLIEKADEYPAISLFWLKFYSEPEAIKAITGFIDNDDVSIRYEAADALGKVQMPTDESAVEYVQALIDALIVAGKRSTIEEDSDVAMALQAAVMHLMNAVLQPGTSE